MGLKGFLAAWAPPSHGVPAGAAPTTPLRPKCTEGHSPPGVRKKSQTQSQPPRQQASCTASKANEEIHPPPPPPAGTPSAHGGRRQNVCCSDSRSFHHAGSPMGFLFSPLPLWSRILCPWKCFLLQFMRSSQSIFLFYSTSCKATAVKANSRSKQSLLCPWCWRRGQVGSQVAATALGKRRYSASRSQGPAGGDGPAAFYDKSGSFLICIKSYLAPD